MSNFVYPFTVLLTPCCRVLLEQVTGLQLVKKFPAFHGTPKFITALTSVRHLSLSWTSPIQSIYTHPTSCRSILISTHLRVGLRSGLFPSGFPTKTLYTPLSSPIRATCPMQQKLWSCCRTCDSQSIHIFCCPPVTRLCLRALHCNWNKILVAFSYENSASVRKKLWREP